MHNFPHLSTQIRAARPYRVPQIHGAKNVLLQENGNGLNCASAASCSIYDRNGNVPKVDDGVGCLTDTEVRSALTVLLQEWQHRFGGEKINTERMHAQLQ